jgi:hypothetical protein
MKKSHPCDLPGCGQVRNGQRHTGLDADHDYIAPAKAGFGARGSTLRGRSERPERVKRYEGGQEAMQRHREAVPYCEAAAYGLTTPCGTGPIQGKIDQQHVIPRGAGGGRDYKKLISLCHQHHMWTEEHRTEAREMGLSEPAPIPEKVVQRRIRKWK